MKNDHRQLWVLLMDELLEPDLVEAMKQVCLYADRRGMHPTYTSVMHQVIEKHESGVWQGFDTQQKLLYIESMDHPLFGQPGEIYEFAGFFTSAEEKRSLSRFTTLLRQIDRELRNELDAQRSLENASAPEQDVPAPPLTAKEQDLSTVLDSISMTPEMGDQFMVAALFLRNLLASGDWGRLSTAEKRRHLEFLDSPQIHQDMARHERGAKLALMLERVRQSLAAEAGTQG